MAALLIGGAALAINKYSNHRKEAKSKRAFNDSRFSELQAQNAARVARLDGGGQTTRGCPVHDPEHAGDVDEGLRDQCTCEKTGTGCPPAYYDDGTGAIDAGGVNGVNGVNGIAQRDVVAGERDAAARQRQGQRERDLLDNNNDVFDYGVMGGETGVSMPYREWEADRRRMKMRRGETANGTGSADGKEGRKGLKKVFGFGKLKG